MTRKYKQYKIKRLTWIKIGHGEDLLQALSSFFLEKNIQLGYFSIIGALQKVTFSYYQQEKKRYKKKLMNKKVEIISCIGNVSTKNGKPFVHAHLSVADKKGNVFGGHLEEGTIVFACECAFWEIEGDILERKFDDITGLYLWDFFK